MKLAVGVIALSLVLISGQVQAATILKVFNSELVLIDKGEDASFQKSEEICFFKRHDTPLGCGRIEILGKNQSYVKVDLNLAKKLFKGMRAESAKEIALAEAKKAEKEAAAAAIAHARALMKAEELAAAARAVALQASRGAEPEASITAPAPEKASEPAAALAAKAPPPSAPVSPAPEAPAPETPAPETPAPEAPAPEAPAPEAPAPEATAPEAPSPTEAASSDTPTPEVLAGPLSKNQVSLRYLYTPQAPAYFKPVSYLSPLDKLGNELSVSTLWEQKKVVASSILGIALAYELPYRGGEISMGGRFRDYGLFSYKADYEGDEDTKAESNLSASAYGAFGDYYFYFKNVWILNAKLGAGLDYDYSQVAMKMYYKTDDSSSTYFNYLSTLTVISVRLPFDFAYHFASFSAHLGGSLILPLYSSSTNSANVKDPQASENLKDKSGKLDLDESIAHQASPVAIELQIAAAMAF